MTRFVMNENKELIAVNNITGDSLFILRNLNVYYTQLVTLDINGVFRRYKIVYNDPTGVIIASYDLVPEYSFDRSYYDILTESNEAKEISELLRIELE